MAAQLLPQPCTPSVDTLVMPSPSEPASASAAEWSSVVAGAASLRGERGAGLPAHGCPLAARCWVQGCSARPALGCSTAGRVPGQLARHCCRGRAGLGQRAGHVARAPRRGVGALGCGSLVCLEGPSARMETPFHLVRAAVLPCHPHRRRRTGLSQGSPAGNCVTGWLLSDYARGSPLWVLKGSFQKRLRGQALGVYARNRRGRRVFLSGSAEVWDGPSYLPSMTS